MLEIIRARAMPYFSHVLVSEKKVTDAYKEYIVAETESDLIATEIKLCLKRDLLPHDYLFEIYASLRMIFKSAIFP